MNRGGTCRLPKHRRSRASAPRARATTPHAAASARFSKSSKGPRNSAASRRRAVPGGGGGAPPHKKMLIANAPCSWGVLEFQSTSAAPSAAQVLDEIAATGYVGTELGDWGFMPTDPRRLAVDLDARHLALVGAFVDVALTDPAAHEAGEATAVRTARLLADAVRLARFSSTGNGRPSGRPSDGLKPVAYRD